MLLMVVLLLLVLLLLVLLLLTPPYPELRAPAMHDGPPDQGRRGGGVRRLHPLPG